MTSVKLNSFSHVALQTLEPLVKKDKIGGIAKQHLPVLSTEHLQKLEKNVKRVFPELKYLIQDIFNGVHLKKEAEVKEGDLKRSSELATLLTLTLIKIYADYPFLKLPAALESKVKIFLTTSKNCNLDALLEKILTNQPLAKDEKLLQILLNGLLGEVETFFNTSPDALEIFKYFNISDQAIYLALKEPLKISDPQLPIHLCKKIKRDSPYFRKAVIALGHNLLILPDLASLKMLLKSLDLYGIPSLLSLWNQHPSWEASLFSNELKERAKTIERLAILIGFFIYPQDLPKDFRLIQLKAYVHYGYLESALEIFVFLPDKHSKNAAIVKLVPAFFEKGEEHRLVPLLEREVSFQSGAIQKAWKSESSQHLACAAAIFVPVEKKTFVAMVEKQLILANRSFALLLLLHRFLSYDEAQYFLPTVFSFVNLTKEESELQKKALLKMVTLILKGMEGLLQSEDRKKIVLFQTELKKLLKIAGENKQSSLIYNGLLLLFSNLPVLGESIQKVEKVDGENLLKNLSLIKAFQKPVFDWDFLIQLILETLIKQKDFAHAGAIAQLERKENLLLNLLLKSF
jgi:hypothetical protein